MTLVFTSPLHAAIANSPDVDGLVVLDELEVALQMTNTSASPAGYGGQPCELCLTVQATSPSIPSIFACFPQRSMVQFRLPRIVGSC